MELVRDMMAGLDPFSGAIFYARTINYSCARSKHLVKTWKCGELEKNFSFTNPPED